MMGVCALLVFALWFHDGTAAPESIRAVEKSVGTSGVETLNRAIHEQSERLRRRLNDAPQPRTTMRNPFEFVVAPHRRVLRDRTAPVTSGAEGVATRQLASESEPELALLGVASNEREGHRIRIAVIGGGAEALWMLEEGQMLGMQYRVTRIEEESAELLDVISGTTRRLLFR